MTYLLNLLITIFLIILLTTFVVITVVCIYLFWFDLLPKLYKEFKTKKD